MATKKKHPGTQRKRTLAFFQQDEKSREAAEVTGVLPRTSRRVRPGLRLKLDKSQSYDDLICGVALDWPSLRAYSPLDVESGMTLIEIVDGLLISRDVMYQSGLSPTPPRSRLRRVELLLGIAAVELRLLTEQADVWAKPTLSTAVALLECIGWSLVPVQDLWGALLSTEALGKTVDTISGAHRRALHRTDLLFQGSRPADEASARDFFKKHPEVLKRLRSSRMNLLAEAAEVAKRTLRQCGAVSDERNTGLAWTHSVGWHVSTRAQWARFARTQLSSSLRRWVGVDPETKKRVFLETGDAEAPLYMEDVASEYVYDVIHTMELLAGVPELQELTLRSNLDDRMGRTIAHIEAELGVMRLRGKVPDGEALAEWLITQTLIGLGYPERKARSLWDADQVATKRGRSVPTSKRTVGETTDTASRGRKAQRQTPGGSKPKTT